ncbi:response regulator [Paenibacillus piri]|uniref:Response regulator n=1 Tax=Paenibacillus piri TaxID=2547395 RepID=A0A4R5KY95_9BACL|nr:response regulator [Paenibacillus piri]TDG00196.1 response regulator [Paenibacillus piri]
MRVVLVDDERLALVQLKKLLGELEGCEVVGAFMNAEEAVKQIHTLRPDVMFLDIHMPEMNGIQATERIRAIAPETEIVFVTAHHEYALKAFGLEALDYILKPLTRERLNQTVQRLRRRISSNPGRTKKETLRILCMGMLQFQKPDEEPERLKWRTAKIKELFAYLLHHRQRMVSRDALLELLWPELDEQKGSANLHTSIHRIRAIVKESLGERYISIGYSHFGYIMETRELTIDVTEWEEQLRQLPRISSESAARHQEVLDRYRGSYFEDDNYSWAELERQRLKALWMQHASQLGQYYCALGMETEALAVYHRMQRLDPLLEDSCLALMRIYAGRKDAESVELQFHYLAEKLQQEAGAVPGPEITEWYRRWKQAEKANESRK